MHAYVYKCLYFKTIAINFYMIEAMSPECVVTITEIAKTCPKQDIDEQNKSIIASAAEACDIMDPSALDKP